MSDPKPVYLVNSSRGLVVTQHARGSPSGAVMEHAGFKGNEQKWILEFGEEPDTVAMKCMANNQYLTASGECYKPVDTGQKTWWKMLYSEVRVPSAFRLCVDGAEEKNCIQVQGSEGTGIKLMLYEWDVRYRSEHQFAFHFVSADGAANAARPARAGIEPVKQDEDNNAKQKTLEEREAALGRHENADKKALEDREAALAQKEKDYSINRRALEDREVAWLRQQGDSAASKKNLEDREAALAQQEKDCFANKQALKDRAVTLQQREKDSVASRKIFEQRKAAFEQKEKDFAVYRKALDDREAALAEKEHKRAAEWDKKIKDLQGLRESSAQLKRPNFGNQAGCGTKHYKPPRKINRKVIGLIYEQ